MSFRKFFSIASVLLLLCGLLLAQTETGQIVGTVTDPQGLVVPSAKVTVTNVNTSAQRNTTTNGNGLYTITNLQPGAYTVKVEAANFTSASKSVTVTVGSRNTVDVPLAISGGSNIVEVTSDTGGVAVETQTQTLSSVVTGQQVTELPTITRNPYALVATAGNVANTTTTGGGRGVGVAINGQRDASTDILLDGGENVDEFNSTIGQNTPLDSVGEFRVITSNFSAEYGRASGGVVNVATKGGTNNYHGSVYEFYRGAGLSSNTYDNNALLSDAFVQHQADPIDFPACATLTSADCPGQKSNFVRNQFGYSVGGPVIKDKLFFFSSTEWIRVRSNGTQSAYVIDPGFLGDCANFTDAGACSRIQGFYSSFGTLKPGLAPIQQLVRDCSAANPCPSLVDPVNHPNGGVLFDLVNYNVPSNAGGGAPVNEYQNVERVDFNWTDKTQMYWRYALQSQNFFPGTVSSSAYQGFDTGATTFNNNFLWNVTHIWSPNVVSQSKVVFNRLNTVNPLNGAPSPTLYMRANTNQNIGGVGVQLPGYLPTTPGLAIPFGGPQNLYQFYQDLSWSVGKHQFRFGGQYVHTRDNRVFGAYETSVEALGTSQTTSDSNFVRGNLLSFNGAIDPQGKFPCATDATGTPISVAGCQITLPVTQPRFDRANRYHDLAFYGQDSWKVSNRLTLNLGVRWEYYGVQHNNDPSFDSNFFLGSGSDNAQQVRNGKVFTSTDPNNPVGGLWTPDYNNWAPRVGFAWDIFGDGKTSLRGGYGIGYERNFGNVTFNVIQNPPAYGVVSLQTGDPGCSPCTVTTDNFGPLAGTSVTPVNLPKTSLRAPIQNMSTAYAHFWSLAIEREVAKNTVVALEYSGSKGVKEYTIANINRQGAGPLVLGDNPADQIDPITGLPVRRLNDQFSAINSRGQSGFSFYSGLNLRFQTSNLMNTGLSLVSNYTWSHGLDNTSSTFSEFGNDFNLGLLNPMIPQEDKGDSNFDIRNRWVVSGTWDTPWFKHDQNWFKKNLLGGWTAAPIVTVQSGAPFTLWDCTNAAFNVCPRFFLGDTSVLGQQSAHDVATPEGALAGGSNTFDYVTYNPALNPNYVNPVAGTSEWGVCGVGEGAVNGCPFPSNMLGRNTFRTPGLWNIDLGLYKNLKLTERFSLQLRGEAYNLMNHSNLYVQGGSADASNGAVAVIAKRGGFGSTATDERRNVQLGVKLIF